ncbi:hypothetical protein D9M68_946600 [compost metagenome]
MVVVTTLMAPEASSCKLAEAPSDGTQGAEAGSMSLVTSTPAQPRCAMPPRLAPEAFTEPGLARISESRSSMDGPSARTNTASGSALNSAMGS